MRHAMFYRFPGNSQSQLELQQATWNSNDMAVSSSTSSISITMAVVWLLLIVMVRGSLVMSLKSLEKYGVSVYSSKLADKFKCELKKAGENICDETGLILQENNDDGAIELAWGMSSGVKEVPFRIDFATVASKKRGKMSRTELVSKAMGSKTSHVIDLTAGLGRDSFILASSGYNVCMLERNPVIFYLLSDAIQRLHDSNPELAKRMKLVEIDSKEVIDLTAIGIEPTESDTISVYLDPMYEGNVVGKRSNVKKETAMLHRLVRDDSEGIGSNSKLLFETAKRLSNSRIIVKRASKAEALANTVPHEAIEGSTHRFDIYFKNRNIVSVTMPSQADVIAP